MVDTLTAEKIAQLLPQRPKSGHKGTFGHLMVLAGSRGFTGAPVLVCNAATRSGVGLVSLGIPETLADILAISLLEPMSLSLPATEADSLAYEGLDAILAFGTKATAMAIGPGLSQHPSTARLARTLTLERPLPMVADADALNAWQTHRSRLVRRTSEGGLPDLVCTPHPGEMARLTGLSTKTIQQDRAAVANRHAELWQATVVLKGHETIIAAPNGDNALCPTGNHGLGTGGAGDVLTGIIGALLAQGMTGYEAACAGVYIHGLAGDLAATEMTPRAMIARDIIAALPHAWRTLEEPHHG